MKRPHSKLWATGLGAKMEDSEISKLLYNQIINERYQNTNVILNNFNIYTPDYVQFNRENKAHMKVISLISELIADNFVNKNNIVICDFYFKCDKSLENYFEELSQATESVYYMNKKHISFQINSYHNIFDLNLKFISNTEFIFLRIYIDNKINNSDISYYKNSPGNDDRKYIGNIDKFYAVIMISGNPLIVGFYSKYTKFDQLENELKLLALKRNLLIEKAE